MNAPARIYAKRHIPSGGPQHRIPKVVKTRAGARLNLAADHDALVEGRTLFPSTVVDPVDSPRLLVSGFNSRKTGGKVTVGAWAGMPIYTLTLEERATCPRSCREWKTCYGNNMHFARRHRAGVELEVVLMEELRALAAKHPDGFVVRLHILSDFYSTDYANMWLGALETIPQLRVFGYTARAPSDPIGAIVSTMSAWFPSRCRIRFSGAALGGLGSIVIETAAESKHVICPAQTGKTDCCATCALCWTMEKTVEFLRH